MSGNRFRIVLLLLVLILLVVSALFGVLTYWLDGEVQSLSPPGQESSGAPVSHHPSRGGAFRLRATQAPQRVGVQT